MDNPSLKSVSVFIALIDAGDSGAAEHFHCLSRVSFHDYTIEPTCSIPLSMHCCRQKVSQVPITWLQDKTILAMAGVGSSALKPDKAEFVNISTTITLPVLELRLTSPDTGPTLPYSLLYSHSWICGPMTLVPICSSALNNPAFETGNDNRHKHGSLES